MTNKQKELFTKKALQNQELNYYEKRLINEKLDRFKKLVSYDYETMMVKKNQGNEARTFSVMNQQKPLLSPSRIAKTFQEHIFWSIPSKNLWKPRLIGQAIHKLLELSIINQNREVFDIQKLEDWYTLDFQTMKVEDWTKESILFFIDEINEAVKSLLLFLERNKIEVVAVEKHIANEIYHGFIDILGIQNEKVPVLIDLKTTTLNQMSNAYINQLAIYNELLEGTCQCWILFFDRNTKNIKFEKVEIEKLKEHFKIINDFVKLYN